MMVANCQLKKEKCLDSMQFHGLAKRSCGRVICRSNFGRSPEGVVGAVPIKHNSILKNRLR
jgi:hypothetical protein